MKKYLKTYPILLLTAAIWGFAFIAQLLGSDIPNFVFNGTRFLLGAFSLIPVVLIFERVKIEKDKMRHTLIAGTIAGTVLFIASFLQQSGITMTTSAGKSGFITGLYMILVPIIGVFLKRKTTINTWLGAIYAVGGLYLLSFPNGISSVGYGDLVLLIGAVFWALHIIVIDLFCDKIYTIRFSMIQFVVCALLNIICIIIFEDFELSMIVSAKYPILYAGLMSTGVAYTLQVIGQKNAEPTIASIVLSTESVFAAVGEAVFFGFIMTGYEYTKMTLQGYIGCAVMFIGIVIAQLNFKKQKC